MRNMMFISIVLLAMPMHFSQSRCYWILTPPGADRARA